MHVILQFRYSWLQFMVNSLLLYFPSKTRNFSYNDFLQPSLMMHLHREFLKLINNSRGKTKKIMIVKEVWKCDFNFFFDFLQELFMVWEAVSNISKCVSSDFQLKFEP